MSLPEHNLKNIVSVSSDTDNLQKCFALTPPMIACLVRHIDRDMMEVTTPTCIEHCIVELQSYFHPHIETNRVVEHSIPGSKLRLQFGKAMDINAGASSSLLNVYIFAVDQSYSRPRLLAHVAKEWRALLERINQENSCFVMLYHKDLVEAASVSARRAAGVLIGNAAKKPDQKKADAAVALLESYFEELRALKFAPHQMCTYLPNEAPIRVVERLRAAFIERKLRLLTLFEDYLKRRRHTNNNHNNNNNNNNNSSSNGISENFTIESWKLQEFWRRGYDLAMHFLQFGVVGEALNIFAKMFNQYYYHSEDYSFIESQATIERLEKLPNLFEVNLTSSGSDNYPSVLSDNAELVDGLLLIVACEIKCALILGKREVALDRYKSFLQVAREKFTEDESCLKISKAWEYSFLLRCAISAMRLNWGMMNLSRSNSFSPSPPMSPGVHMPPISSMITQQRLSPAYTDPTFIPIECESSLAVASPENASSFMIFPSIDEVNKEAFNYAENVKAAEEAICVERLEILSHSIGMEWVGRFYWVYVLLAKLAGDALEFLIELGEIIGFPKLEQSITVDSLNNNNNNNNSSVVDVNDFGMPELASKTAFFNFYRNLTELLAICFALMNNRYREHTMYYKLALSYKNDEPEVTVELCRRRLIPFLLKYGWLQLQTIIFRLYVESMEIVIQRRKKNGQNQELLLNKDEVNLLKESILHIISALGEKGALQEEIGYLTGKEHAEIWWRRLKNVDNWWNYKNEINTNNNNNLTTCYSLSILLKQTLVFCLNSDGLIEGGCLKSNAAESAAISATNSIMKNSINRINAKIGETVLICFSAYCPIDMLKSDKGENTPKQEEETETNINSNIFLTATLVSKKDWKDMEEFTHVVEVNKLISSSYDVETKRLYWVWEFQPCRSGEYQLRCITLRIAGTTLMHLHTDPLTFSNENNSTDTTSFSSSSNNNNYHNNNNKSEILSRYLLYVPEPESGIKLIVHPPLESHCFADSLNFFTIDIEIEQPLYLLQGKTSSILKGGERNENVEKNIEKSNTGSCRNCTFEPPLLSKSITFSASTSAAITAAMGTISPRDFRLSLFETTNSTIPTIINSDKSTLAFIYVSRHRRQTGLRPGILNSSIVNAPSRNLKDTSLLIDAALRRIEHDVNEDISPIDISLGINQLSLTNSLITIKDEKTGALTSIPVNEQFIMGSLQPPIIRKSSKIMMNKINSGIVSMCIEGNIITLPRQICCFKIRVEKNEKEKQEEEEYLIKENNDFLEATTLQCSIPLLPIFMSGGDENAQVSLNYQRHMESFTTSVSVPLRLKPAFTIIYSFKFIQGRVYCLIQVENILEKTSLWLRGVILELLDNKPYYELARVSSTHERLMLREWKPKEIVHLFFELAPLSIPHMHEKEVRHRVRLQLLYSNWIISEERKPLEQHILRPLLSTSTYSSLNSSMFDETVRSVKQPNVQYDINQLELLRTTCNIYQGPIGAFTSKHSSLFNVIIFIDTKEIIGNQNSYSPSAISLSLSGQEGKNYEGESKLSNFNTSIDSANTSMFPIGTSSLYLPGGFLFPAGEPIRFSVLLEPLAHNWPDGCNCEEEFLITFKVDPNAWLITGKQKIRKVLSMMEDETIYFTAVPVPVLPHNTNKNNNNNNNNNNITVGKEDDFILQQQKHHHHQQQQQEDLLSTVATPTIEIHWASHINGNKKEIDTVVEERSSVAIEVVQFRTSMRIRH